MLESIILDDGIEYLIYDTEKIDNVEYTLFVNVKDATDICFRKTITENDEDFYVYREEYFPLFSELQTNHPDLKFAFI